MNRNITKDLSNIRYYDRCHLIGQRGQVFWLYGLSGSGKSTLSKALEKRLFDEQKCLIYRLDGDNLRYGINSDLGFSEKDRNENIRRVAEIAAILADAGVIVVVSVISPLQSMREQAKKIIGEKWLTEIYVKADLETCEARDPKGLYKKARNGEIEKFTGVDSIFEEPCNSVLTIDTRDLTVEESVNTILNSIKIR